MLTKLQNLSPTAKGLIGVITATMLFGIMFIGVLSSVFLSVRGEVRSKELRLNATDGQSQAILDQITRDFATTSGIANLKTDKLKEIMEGAVMGRYIAEDGSKTGIQPTGGAMFSAISEAYPDVDLTQYDRLMDIVVSGNARWSNQQQRMQDMARDYETYINTGGVTRQLMLATFVKAPSDKLKTTRFVEGTNLTLRGQSALDMMQTVLQSSATRDAFGTGELEPQVMPGTESSTAPAANG